MENKNTELKETNNPNINSNNVYADDEFDFVDADENTIEDKNTEIESRKNEAGNNHLEKDENKDFNQTPKEMENEEFKVNQAFITSTEPLEKTLSNNENNNEFKTNILDKELNDMSYFKGSVSNNKENGKNLNENPTDNINNNDDETKISSEVIQVFTKEKDEAHFDLVEETAENKNINFIMNEQVNVIVQDNQIENKDNKEHPNYKLNTDNHLDFANNNKNEKIENHKDSDPEEFIEEVETKNTVKDDLNLAVDINKNINDQSDNFNKNEVVNEIKRENNQESNNDEDFDFFEASEEENKNTNMKDTNNHPKNEASKVNVECMCSIQNPENTHDFKVESDELKVSEETNDPVVLNQRSQDFPISDEKEDSEFQEIEESVEPAEDEPIDSFVNRDQVKENHKIELNVDKTEPFEDQTKQENVDNQDEFIFEEQEEDIKMESKIEDFNHEAPNQKEKETENNEEFDFVDETEENVNTNIAETNKINEEITNDDPKNSDESEHEKEDESKEEKYEFDAKKIMDYSFSSSDEEDDHDKKAKKPVGQLRDEIIEKDENEQKEDFTIQQDKLQDIQEPNPEDNLDNLEFEDCFENNENKDEKLPDEVKKETHHPKNNPPEDEDVFDFVEEDNIETNANNKVDVEAKEEIDKIDKNDDEFDFVEESEPQVNNNSEPKFNSNNNINNQINQTTKNVVFINKDHINNLLNNYRNKFIINNPNFAYLDEASIAEKSESLQSKGNSVKQTNEIQEINSKDEPDESKEENTPKIKENVEEKKQEIEEDEFLDVENEDEIDKTENKPISQTPVQPTEILGNKGDSKTEKRLKAFFDLENFKFEINESKYENFDFSQQAIGFEQKQANEVYKPISIQKQIENLQYFNSEPEINMRGYSLEELNKLSKSFNTKLNIKNTIFNHGVMEFPNEITRKLFFQFSDLRLILNSNSALNQFHDVSKNTSNNNLDNLFPLISQNTQIDNSSKSNNLKADSRQNNNKDENIHKKNSNEQIASNPNNNPNSNVSSINNKESMNTTININNMSINDNVNKDKVLENIKELKLLNEKNTDLFNKNKSNNQSALSPNTQTNYLEALNNLKDSDNSNNYEGVQKNPLKEEKPKATTGINLESNKVNMRMKEQKEIDSDSFDEINEYDDESSDNKKRDNKPKFVMNEMMSSVFSAVGNSKNQAINNLHKSNDKREEIVEEKPKEVTEIDMLEMLKSMGITKKDEKADNSKNNEIEKNNEKLNEIINRLPNLNYLTSKYVEIPDSIFNI